MRSVWICWRGPYTKRALPEIALSTTAITLHPVATVLNADTSVRDSSVVATFQEEIAVTEDERQELSVMGMSTIEEGGLREFAASFNTQNFSWLYELPLQEISYPPPVAPEGPQPDPLQETQPFSPSQQNVRGCSQDSSEEQSQRGGDFACFWVPAFLSCETLLDLEGVLEPCTADWLPKAQILEDPSPEKPRGNPNGRKRNQNRQMQKARQQIKLKAYEARKIQRLFNIYPRRAVQEVLGDRSPSYDGTVEAAEEYLERTYHRSSLPSQQCQSARVL
ncbi:hypothetical protein OUZ56_025697 [Daphnia magna]|uniref:BZIP domain-containing protein n=1 Tax=Daphnia magna TaxID=35525 RepID=A0ABQ9ZKB6_9CRUS|nr:hypothetical protein OUZ56_025697 [Daphnia magna]